MPLKDTGRYNWYNWYNHTLCTYLCLYKKDKFTFSKNYAKSKKRELCSESNEEVETITSMHENVDSI